MACRKRGHLGLDPVVTTPPELNQNILNGGLTFPLSISQRCTYWKENHITGFERYYNKYLTVWLWPVNID